MHSNQDSRCGARPLPRQQVPSSSADRGHSLSSLHLPPAALSSLPIGFGFALSSNTAAMNHFAHLPEGQKQDILQKARNVQSEEEMYTLVAGLANNQLQ